MQRDLVVILYDSNDNDNEISLRFKPMGLIFMNYTV